MRTLVTLPLVLLLLAGCDSLVGSGEQERLLDHTKMYGDQPTIYWGEVKFNLSEAVCSDTRCVARIDVHDGALTSGPLYRPRFEIVGYGQVTVPTKYTYKGQSFDVTAAFEYKQRYPDDIWAVVTLDGIVPELKQQLEGEQFLLRYFYAE